MAIIFTYGGKLDLFVEYLFIFYNFDTLILMATFYLFFYEKRLIKTHHLPSFFYDKR